MSLYDRIRARSRHNHAIFVVARPIAWLLLKHRPYKELGPHYLESPRGEQAKRRCLNQPKRLGYQVTLAPISTAA